MLRTNEFRNCSEGTLEVIEYIGKNIVFGLWSRCLVGK